MQLPVMPPLPPMLAQLSETIPLGDYLYEPKWDGFRAIVFRDGDELVITSRQEKPLGRYFPEVVEALKPLLPPRIVLDGEIVIAGAHGLDFDALQLRLHPAASRIAKLAREIPAQLVAFDLIALGDEDLRPWPLRRRRAALEEALSGTRPPLHLTRATTDPELARDWFERFEGAGLDGVIAKPLDQPYVPGERIMTKIKHRRTADCVVGGFRMGKDKKGLASLLLGLYDSDGTLHHVGVASGFAAARRRELEAALQPLRDGAAATHPWVQAWGISPQPDADGMQRIPGGPSRWTGDRDLAWEPVRPELVVEVAYDHLQGNRFRHATQFVRWRPDRTADSCRYDQLDTVTPAELADILGARPA
jgi:ATP-dependent DNA ligase